jgi:hypothetical protein
MNRLAAVCAVLMLAACSMPGTQQPAPATLRAESRVDSDASSSALLYVSDWSTNQVFMYDFSTKALVGKLKGFDGPYGECVDAGGNVWIADLNGSAILQYAHGATKPSRRLRTSGTPIGCAINTNNGDLAVANFSTTSGKGNIQVWPGGRVPSKTYQPSKYYYLWPPAYNATGDLFAEGQVLNGAYGLTELPKGASTLRSVKLGGVTIHYAGGVFWDGHALGVTDQNAGNDNTTTIYRMTFKGANGRLVGRTHLTDTCNKDYADVVTPFPVRTNGTTTEVIGGNLWCAHRFDYWKYPAGGTPTSQLPKAPEEPFGESVSPARKAGSD